MVWGWFGERGRGRDRKREWLVGRECDGGRGKKSGRAGDALGGLSGQGRSREGVNGGGHGAGEEG